MYSTYSFPVTSKQFATSSVIQWLVGNQLFEFLLRQGFKEFI